MRTKFSKITQAAGIALALALTLSCSSSNDGEAFETVTIGTQTWMAKNLNYDVKGSVCYNNDPTNCDKYGRLYNWTTAMSVCPSGWHLPSKDEWYALIIEVGGSSVAGMKLKARNSWSNGGNGEDSYNFSALPGGAGNSDGIFGDSGNGGFWWSSTEDSDEECDDCADFQIISYNQYTEWASTDKSVLFSVRCLQN